MKLYRYSILVIAAIMLILPVDALSQKEWTLEECIQYALDNNINIKRQEVRADQSSNNHKQAWLDLLPSASASFTHSNRFGKSLNEDTYEYVNEQFQYGSGGAGADLNLFNGWESINMIKMRRYEMLAQLEQIEEARYNVTMNIVTYYLMVLSAIEQKNIREEQLAVTLEQIEQVQQQIEVGKKARGELLEIKAQAASERADLTRAKNDLTMAYVDLAQLMNLDSVDQFRVRVPKQLEVSKEQPVKETDSVYSEAVKDFPTIQMAAYQLEGAKKNLKVTKGDFYPQLSLTSQISSYYSELAPLSNWEQFREANVRSYIGLTLRIPLFNQLNKFTRVANAKLDVQNNKLMLEEQKQNLYKDIQRARNEAIAAYENYQANLEAVESYEEAFNYAEERYEVGLVDAVQYRIAKNDLSRARSNVANSKYNFIFKMKILEFYMGQEMQL